MPWTAAGRALAAKKRAKSSKHRQSQHFTVMDKKHHRLFGSLTNTAVLDKKLKTMIHGRRHSMTNKGVLNLSGHHSRRHH